MNYKFPKVNYIGNKEKLVEWIGEKLPVSQGTILDLFAGGSSVSYFFKKKGFKVIANDALYSSFVLNKALIENKEITLNENHINLALNKNINNEFRNKIDWLSNNLYYSEEVSELSKLVHYSLGLESYEKYIFQTLIRRAMIRKLPYSRMNVNWENIKKLRNEDYSYEKYGRRRSYHNKSFADHILKELDIYNLAIFDNFKENRVMQMDAIEALKGVNEPLDIVYVDPPYPGTMNNYKSFYGPFDKMFGKDIKYTNLTDKNNFLYNLEMILKESCSKSRYFVLSINTNVDPSYENIILLMKKYGNISMEVKKHNYQVTGKSLKNSNKELLLITDFY